MLSHHPHTQHSNVSHHARTGLCVLLGAWRGPVATLEADCAGCLQACQLHSECVSLVHNGIDIAREGTQCVSGMVGDGMWGGLRVWVYQMVIVVIKNCIAIPVLQTLLFCKWRAIQTPHTHIPPSQYTHTTRTTQPHPEPPPRSVCSPVPSPPTPTFSSSPTTTLPKKTTPLPMQHSSCPSLHAAQYPPPHQAPPPG